MSRNNHTKTVSSAVPLPEVGLPWSRAASVPGQYANNTVTGGADGLIAPIGLGVTMLILIVLGLRFCRNHVPPAVPLVDSSETEGCYSARRI